MNTIFYHHNCVCLLAALFHAACMCAFARQPEKPGGPRNEKLPGTLSKRQTNETFSWDRTVTFYTDLTQSWERCPCLCTGSCERVGILNEKWARLAMQKHSVFQCRIAKKHHDGTKGWIERRKECHFKDEISVCSSGTLSTKTNKCINFPRGRTDLNRRI